MLWRMILFKIVLLVFMCFAYSMPTDDKENKEAVEEAEKSAESESDAKLVPVEVGNRKSYLREYGDKDSKKNTKGYRRKSDDQGEDGYKHFDSFHKKHGDKYGYESHSAYGRSKKSRSMGGAANTKYDDKEHDHEGAESRRVYHVIKPWHGHDVASYLPHIDIEAIASKFDHNHHHYDDHHFTHHYHDHDHHLELDHYPEHKHYHHSYHSDDIEYDHPPHDKNHPEFNDHHVVEDDHDLHHPDHHEIHHPPPSYFDHHSSDKHGLDHHSGHDFEHPEHHKYDQEYDHHDHPEHHKDDQEYDHPPPGYETDNHHDSKPSHHTDSQELDHPPPGYETDNHHDSKAHHTDSQELDHPPLGYEDPSKAYLPPPNGGDGSQPPHGDELDHPPPAVDQTERKDSQIYPSGAPAQITSSAVNSSNERGVINQGRFDGVYFGGPFNPDQHEKAEMTLNVSQISTQQAQIPSPKPDSFKNDQKDNHTVSDAFISSQNNSTTAQVVPNEEPQLTTQAIPTYLPPAVQSGQSGQPEHAAFNPANSGVTNYNYKIYFGGLTNPDYQKRYYDLDHWDQTLKELRNNQARFLNLSEQRNNVQNDTYNIDSKTDDSLRDSYGNLYMPIDLRNYLPALPQGSNSDNSNSSKEITQANKYAHDFNFSANNDGIFFGRQFNPDDYFGGPIEAANVISSNQTTDQNFGSFSSVDQNVSKTVLDNTKAYIPFKQVNVNTDQLRNLQDHPFNINNAIYFGDGFNGGSQTPVASNIGDSNSNPKGHKLKNIFDSIKNNYYLPPLNEDQNHENYTSNLSNGTETDKVTRENEEGQRTSTPTTVEIIPAVEVPFNRSESVDNEVSQLERQYY